MWVPGSQKEPKQLHGRKERIPSPDAWSGVLDHIHSPQKVSYVRGVVHGTLSREFTWERRRGCRMSPGYRIQRRAGKSPLLGASQEEENANEISPWMSHLLLFNSKDHPERLY